MNVTTIAAGAFLVVAFATMLFQAALALGAPWGSYAMGGKFPGRFPPAMRIGAVVQGLIIGLMGAIILARAGVGMPQWSSAAVWLTWVIVGFSAISVVMNALTPSADERRVWLPAAVVLLTTSLAVAITAA